jgi:hypothetical protein
MERSVHHGQVVTPHRFLLAMVLFHAVALGVVGAVGLRWRDRERCRGPIARWAATMARDLAAAAVAVYGASLVAASAANLGTLERLRLGSISLRLMGQALFGEAIVLGLVLALRHRHAGRTARARALAAVALVLLAVYVDAFHVEPNTLRVRHHTVDGAGGDADAQTIPILHLTDIQTPAIGAHEDRALRSGLAARPDLIVLTGDYVQDALGRPTEDRAARDLRSLMARIGFGAPLGVFATEGDVGPSCRDIFAGTAVQCLVDASTVVSLPGGGTLGITGLSRGHGRERNAA